MYRLAWLVEALDTRSQIWFPGDCGGDLAGFDRISLRYNFHKREGGNGREQAVARGRADLIREQCVCEGMRDVKHLHLP